VEENKQAKIKKGEGGSAVEFYRRLFLIAWGAMLLSIPVGADVVDKIVAVVNEDVITLSGFNAAFEPYLKRIEENYQGKDREAVIKQGKEAFLQRLIDNMLIEQEAKKIGAVVVVKDEEVMDVIKGMLEKRKSTMDDFLKNLAREGKSLESVKGEIRNQIVRMRLLRREVKAKIVVNDEEIGEYYNKNRQNYEGKEAVRVKQILLLFPPKANKAMRMKVKDQTNNLRKRIKNGEPFELLAVKYSQGPEAKQGGDVGFIERGVIIPEVESVAFSLPVGQVSAVIESSLGFHIIMVVDKRGAGLKPIAAVREEIKAKIEDEKLDKRYEEWITSIRKKSYIEIRL
jgi:peptidyl-prolyl cis-trans isomerase SurA